MASFSRERRDMFIEFIKAELYHGFALGLPDTYLQTMTKIEAMVEEHRACKDVSGLKQLIPSVSQVAHAYSRYLFIKKPSRRRMTAFFALSRSLTHTHSLTHFSLPPSRAHALPHASGRPTTI